MSIKKFNVGVKVLEMKRHLLNYCLIISRQAGEFSARGQHSTMHWKKQDTKTDGVQVEQQKKHVSLY